MRAILLELGVAAMVVVVGSARAPAMQANSAGFGNCSGGCTATRTNTATPTPTATLVPCLGDCDANGAVSISELILNVDIALDGAAPGECPASACFGSPALLINCLLEMVNNALTGCRTYPAPTSTPRVPYTLSSLHELCGEDSGEALLARVRGQYSGTVTPQSGSPWTSPFGFTLELAYHGGTITCYPDFVPQPGSRETPVPAHVGMVMAAQFDTDNGAFAEMGETNLDEPPIPGYADIFLSRTPDEIEGSYRPDYQGVNVEIAATLKGDSVNGVIALRGAPLGDSQYLVIGRYQGIAAAGR
jgi:hypothetical protein